MAACQLFVVLALFTTVFSSKYEENAKVVMYVNKVGPYFNPHETYHYYQLPVCRPDKIEHKSLTLGEVLDGDRMAVSMYNINFKQDVANKELCRVRFEEDDLQLLRDAIEDLYYFEFVIDDIPIRGFIGHLEEGGFLPHTHKVYLWAHLHFNIEYNGEHIIYANVSTKEKEPVSLDDVTAPLEVAFTYSVKWHNSGLKYEERSKRLRDNSFFPKTLEIHWLSIINSMVLVFLLIGFVVIILTRVLKSDFARYNVDDEESEELDQEDNGWKIIHTDVFRFPAYKNLFCAILGVGMQFLTLATGIIIMAMMGLFNVHRHGQINSAGVILYAFTSCISGYVATNMYRKMGGDNWVWNINLTSALFAAPFVFVWSLVNSVAWAYGTTQALPFGTIILLMCLWMFVGYPLTVIGGIFGKNWANGFDAPCRTKNISREIPSVPWYRSAFAHCLVGGFLPFSAISVELYYIFSTLWGREQYTLYGILFIVFGILLSVTACISVALTYFQLSAEDYRWWWRSIFSAGSTGVFVFLYALFYYYKRSNMSGLLQSLEFFGYTALTCYVFFLMLGTVSFFASLTFVRYIYVNLKMD
ncbi:transmembrane 9 superfamily member 1-like isoform X2 [Mya arenaria]|uniref:transmembrane 9 superfamily member 1-like isoform X2 n=1 Tax=Mya arenaria TaxID=6604 RepID=UPI0022DF50A1|nr:transmembrane 9 superfamily member 1-like isoform X2 [Mya arenaria]XP_052765327.1 transmembrane 9 superfamily member 1-like isoform X2 [Mya arenaria]